MNLSRHLRFLLAAAASLATIGCDKDVAGTTDEHETHVARLYREDGAPAAGARVRLYAVGDTSRTPVAQVFASTDGAIELPKLPEGQYALYATDGSGNGVLIDSLLSTGAGSPELRNDTLRPLGILSGRVAVEPQHSPRIAWVQVLGLGIAANVDTLGNFRLEVPAGRVTVAALTREPQYTPTFRFVTSISDSAVDVGTIRLEYTGIPVVEGLSVSYDTLAGVATVRWSRSTAPGLRGYRLSAFGAFSSLDIDDLADTVYHDTLFRRYKFDTTHVTREYSVVAIDSAREGGLPWRRVTIVAPSPWTIARGNIGDTLLGTVPSAGCSELDTLAGGLVCIKEQQGAGDAYLLHRSDTVTASVSSDGRNWRTLPRFDDVLRVVAWKGRIWVARGIATGVRVPVMTGPVDTLKSMYGVPVFTPRYAGVLVESWSVDGSLERTDTLLDPQGALCYRLFVARDTLVLTRDSAAYGMTGASGPAGTIAIALDARRLASMDGTWEADPQRTVPSEWREMDRSMTEMIWLGTGTSQIFYEGDPSVAWGGLEWTKYGGALFARESREVTPWQVLSASYIEPYANRVGVRYRGDGETVPAFIVWKGCLLYWRGDDFTLRALRAGR